MELYLQLYDVVLNLPFIFPYIKEGAVVKFFILPGVNFCFLIHNSWGDAVAQRIEELCYKPEGSRLDSECCYWNFSLT